MAWEPFSDEQARTIVNLAQAYAGWIEAERAFVDLPYDLKIREINGAHYLYETVDRDGNGKSLGRLDEEKQHKFDEYRARKSAIKDRREGSRATLDENARLYRALRLPMLPNEAGRILREADRRRMLDGDIMTVGTNAMAAYAIEANGFIRDAPDETQDFDIAWRGDGDAANDNPVWAMLKAVDSTYTVNTERPFQARNRSAYEVEVLVAPSRVAAFMKTDQPSPVPLPEQEWLLMGSSVDQVVVCRDGSPARLVVPDPRYFALQKLWMSEQDKRNPTKRSKDRRQGTALLGAIKQAMPRYSLDGDFERSLPSELRAYFDDWRQAWTPPEAPSW